MKPICIFLLLLLCILPLQAQKNVAKDTLLNREMTLEREYNPNIESASKINHLPELREPQAPKAKVEFSNYSTAYEVQSKLNSLMPKAMLTDLNTSKYAGYATLGLSTLLDFDADAAYQILNTRSDFLSIYFSHRSSNSQNPSLQIPTESQKFFMNDNYGGFNFSHDFDNAKLSADLKYTYSAFNYSGLTVANLEEIQMSSVLGPAPIYEIQTYPNQVNNMLEAHAGIFSDTPNKLNYKVNLKYTYFKQKYLSQTNIPGASENRVIIDWDLHDNYNSTSGFGLSGFYKTYKYSSEEFRAWNANNNDDIMLHSVISLTPYYYLEDDNFNFTLGLRADFELGGKKKAVISPNIRFNYNPSDAFTLYALALGGRNDNCNYDMFYENRYLFPYERVLDSRTYLDGTIGLRYLPVSNISLDVFGGYKITNDEHFFTPRYTPGGENALGGLFMKPNYGTANVFKLGAQLNYTLQDIFGVNVKGTFYNWNVTETVADADGNEDKHAMEAWQKPKFELGTDVYFKSANIPLRIDLILKGLFGRRTNELIGEYSSNVENTYFNMKDAYDLSIKTSYAITPFFFAYLSTNNLLFQKYDILYGYPAQKFNIMGGISVMF